MTKFKPNDRVRVRKNVSLRGNTDPHMTFTMELMKRFRDNDEILVVKEVEDYIISFYDASDIKSLLEGEVRSVWSTLPWLLTKHKVDQNTYPDFEVKDVDTV